VSARFINHVGLYRPGRSARKVNAPILFCICDTDAVAPAETALRYAATAPRGEVKRYPIGHFDIYLGEPFEHAVADQTEFLVRHLAGEYVRAAEATTVTELLAATVAEYEHEPALRTPDGTVVWTWGDYG